MLMISKESMDSVMSVREKIADPKRKAECIADVEDMIKTKESHLARAEWGSCCGSICSLAPQLEGELQLLHSISDVLKKGDVTKASYLLEDYIALLQKNYRPEPEHW
jgi:hypothetical protein